MRRLPRVAGPVAVLVLVAGCLTTGDVLVDRPWRLAEVGGVPAVDPEGVVGVAFGTDGRYRVDTGCSSGGGTYHLDGNRILLDTEVLEPSPCDEAMAAQDRRILAVLEGTPRFELETRTSRLRMTAESGEVLVFTTP